MNFLFDGEFYSNAILILFQHLRVKRIFCVFRLGYLKFALASVEWRSLHHTPKRDAAKTYIILLPSQMIRSTILLVLLSLVAQRGSAVYGYSTLSSIWSPTTLHQQRASYFVGRDVLSPSSSLQRRSASSMIEMKKGKANLPSHMRSQYKRSQEMEAYRQQMMESQVSISAFRTLLI
jgi:hypothetical protein